MITMVKLSFVTFCPKYLFFFQTRLLFDHMANLHDKLLTYSGVLNSVYDTWLLHLNSYLGSVSVPRPFLPRVLYVTFYLIPFRSSVQVRKLKSFSVQQWNDTIQQALDTFALGKTFVQTAVLSHWSLFGKLTNFQFNLQAMFIVIFNRKRFV